MFQYLNAVKLMKLPSVLLSVNITVYITSLLLSVRFCRICVKILHNNSFEITFCTEIRNIFKNVISDHKLSLSEMRFQPKSFQNLIKKIVKSYSLCSRAGRQTRWHHEKNSAYSCYKMTNWASSIKILTFQKRCDQNTLLLSLVEWKNMREKLYYMRQNNEQLNKIWCLKFWNYYYHHKPFCLFDLQTLSVDRNLQMFVDKIDIFSDSKTTLRIFVLWDLV